MKCSPAMRNKLHKTQFQAFQHWMLQQPDVEILEARGDWELLKWDSGDRNRPAIIFDNLRKTHLTVNRQALPWWERFNTYNKNRAALAEARGE